MHVRVGIGGLCRLCYWVPTEPPASEPALLRSPVIRAGSHVIKAYLGRGSPSSLSDKEARQAVRA